MIAFHSTNAKRSSPTSDTNLLSHLDALRQCDALRADRDAAREDARRRLDIVYRIKDDLLDEKNRAEAAEAREAAAVERARTLRQALCEAQDALCDLRPIPSIERNVETNGVYFGLEGVDPWDEQRDARLYAGPYPVVAHPPCARWSRLAHIHKHRWPLGDDGGCFAAALAAVRAFGGVLEHPEGSLAWVTFGLPKPASLGWSQSLNDPGLATEVDQSNYGHRGRKRTWLYYVGGCPAAMDWRNGSGYPVENMHTAGGEASRTPLAFRDVLLAMARNGR